jgi:tetratricopeptide (TPR) repeat protein
MRASRPEVCQIHSLILMMVRLFNRFGGALLVALLAVALAGCASSQKKSTAKLPAKSKTAATADGNYPELSDETIRSYAHYATGLSLDMREDPTAALEEYEKAANADPGEEPLVLDVARRLLRTKQGDRAIALLNKAAAEPGSSGLVHSWLGLAYASIGETNKAVAANRTAMQKLPGQISAYANLCDLYLALGKTNEVVNVLDQAAKQNDAPADFYANLSDVILRMQARDVLGPDDAKKRSVTALDKAMSLKPDDITLRQRIGDAYLFRDEGAKAEAIFEKLWADHAEIPGIRERLINTYLKTNKPKAEAMLNDLRKEMPTNPRPHLFLGRLAMEGNRFPEALEHFETALKLGPNDESTWYQVAALRVAVKKPAEALELLDRSEKQFPRPVFAREFYRGVALLAMERYSEAVTKFTSAELVAKQYEPDKLTADFYFRIGSAAERAKDIDQAVKHFRKALEMDPDFTEALNYLGYMWAERGENLDEARSMIERALKEDPKNAAFLDSMAWVLFKLKKPAEALPYMKKAIELTKEPDATLQDHLGDILAALKRMDEAREAWQKALKIEPKDDIRKKLEQGA